MPEVPAAQEAILEVVSPDTSLRSVRVTHSPFLIGRGTESGNHLHLDDGRISRNCAAILAEGSRYRIEDRGHRHGIFINGKKIEQTQMLAEGDVVTFGFDDCFQITFRQAAAETSIEVMLSRIGSISGSGIPSSGLGKLNLLLEATSLLHSQLPLDSVLGTMLDHAISITGADRGLLLETDSAGALRVRLARRGGVDLPIESLSPSQTALRLAMERKSGVITQDLNEADTALQLAQSIIAQSLRAIVAIPLYAMNRASSTESLVKSRRGQFLGVIYLDSRRPAAFSKLDRQILDALAVEAASILDNARLVERERERQRLEQEMSIARDIQQALLPRGFRDFSYLTVTGIHTPCLGVGGDYFDVFPMSDDRTAILIADVSGKGIGAALLTTMLQGALSGMTIGADPARVITHINRFLCEHTDVGRYATMFFGVLEANGRLEFINAGHPSPLLLRRGEVTELYTEGSFPVGLIPEADFVASEVTLEQGDTLALFSDGVTEASDPDEQMYGDERLSEALAGQHDVPLDQLQKRVLDSVESFTRGAGQADDITLLLVRYRSVAGAATSGV